MPRRPATGRHRVPASTLAAVAAGGVAGALARYAVARGMPSTGASFPWSTLVVNVTGSALLGVVLTAVIELLPRGRLARPLLGTGLIGAYTTFSTFAVDAVLLTRGGRAAEAALYVVTSLVAGLAAAAVGVAGTRLALRARLPAEGGR